MLGVTGLDGPKRLLTLDSPRVGIHTINRYLVGTYGARSGGTSELITLVTIGGTEPICWMRHNLPGLRSTPNIRQHYSSAE